jgi:hypothetical protein
MTGNAKDAPGEQPPCFGVVAVSLPEMGAIAAKLDGKRGIVIQQKRNIPRSGDGHKGFSGARNVIITCVLKAQLQASHIAGIKRRGQGIAKGQRVKPLGGDEIEPTGLFRHDGARVKSEAPHKPEADFLARSG